MKLIELFAGIGTQYRAFNEFIPTEVVAISEIDNRPLKIYNKLFNKVFNLGNITKIESLPIADIWTYSFPCTDLSIAGKKKGFGGENSALIYEVLRLLKVSPKPKVLIMENVTNLVSKTFIRGFEEWIEYLEKEGYTTTWQKMRACDYGGGTIRNRVFAVSVYNSKKNFIFPKKTGTTKVVRDYLEPYDSKFYVAERFDYFTEKSYNKTIKIKDYLGGGQGNRIYSIDGQGITLTATGGGHGASSGLYLRDEAVSKLSGIEMAKIMGWSYNEAIQMKEVATNRELGFVLGNSIDLNVMKTLAEAIVQQFFER